MHAHAYSHFVYNACIGSDKVAKSHSYSIPGLRKYCAIHEYLRKVAIDRYFSAIVYIVLYIYFTYTFPGFHITYVTVFAKTGHVRTWW